MFLLMLISSFLIVPTLSISLPKIYNSNNNNNNNRLHKKYAAVLPGSPLVVGTLTQGTMNGISLYNNLILARVALSWFPQLVGQFPILRPIFTVTEPYLKVFRQTIPPIAGFDISIIPAFFILDILSNTIAAVGCEITPEQKKKLKIFNPKTK